MNIILKRSISGIFYVLIMLFGTYNEISRIILFTTITIISCYEMWRLTKKKQNILNYLYVCLVMIGILLEKELLIYIFILTWTFDTFAYLFGIRYGKHKIMPTISPKKSWEGFIGGLFSTILISLIVKSILDLKDLQAEILILISIIIPFTASLGDFIESKYKRIARVKDSGYFIPGHGGILDRVDALIITIPTIYLLIYITKWHYTKKAIKH